MQQKIFYNLNPDINKKNTSTMTTTKKNINNKKKRFITLRNGKKTRNKKKYCVLTRAPRNKKKNVMFCIYEAFRNGGVMALNVNTYNTKTPLPTHS